MVKMAVGVDMKMSEGDAVKMSGVDVDRSLGGMSDDQKMMMRMMIR